MGDKETDAKAESGSRDLSGRFAVGAPGRPKGARNLRTRNLERFLDDNVPDILDALLKAALGGDVIAAKAIVALRHPPRKDAPLSIQLPLLGSPKDGRNCPCCRAGDGRGAADANGGAVALDAPEGLMRVTVVADLEARLQSVERLALKAAASSEPWGGLSRRSNPSCSASYARGAALR